MPLLNTRLAAAIHVEMQTQFGTAGITATTTGGSDAINPQAVVIDNLLKMATAIANAIVVEINTNLSGTTQVGGAPAHTHLVNPADLG